MRNQLMLFLFFVAAAMVFGLVGCDKDVGITESHNDFFMLQDSHDLKTTIAHFEIELIKSNEPEDGGYAWVWKVTQLGGFDCNTGLSHFDISLGLCAVVDNILHAYYKEEGEWVEFGADTSFGNDPSSSACSDADWLKFNFGAEGTNYYKLVLDDIFDVDLVDALVKYGQGAPGGPCQPGCEVGMIYGIGCPADEEECYEDETGWADGDRYVTRGNWATFTEYEEDLTVTLYAGQTIEAGTVHFSAAVGGEVTVTIELNPGFKFNDTPENVKIQDYEDPPSENPSPGNFDHKFHADPDSDIWSDVVPENNFYGVHVDLLREVPCPEE
jgi:hypothetical protein